MKLTMSLIKADIIAARQAIEYYNNNQIRDIKNVAAYHIQQAAEKLIKIQIYAATNKYNDAAVYTHNLEKLISYAESLEIEFSIPKYIVDNSLVITNWEAGSRYDVGFQIRIDTLQRSLSEVENWFENLYKSGIREA